TLSEHKTLSVSWSHYRFLWMMILKNCRHYRASAGAGEARLRSDRRIPERVHPAQPADGAACSGD
ncbi:hypothetical protein, partial [Escherichia coli]|uniref:hypothetical protein n=1 Tax=Escherichia coli TaxID=562 RepID=UPI0024853BCF